MKNKTALDKDYRTWLAGVKDRVRSVQLKAAVTVSTEFLMLYWELGADIVAKQAQSRWGEGFLFRLSKDLMAEFPDMKGFSLRNIKYIKQWYQFYSRRDAIGQQAVAQLAKQPVSQLSVEWGQVLTLAIGAGVC